MNMQIKPQNSIPQLAPILVKWARINDWATAPSYATAGSACFDLYASLPSFDILLQPGEVKAIPTGLIVEVPKNWAMLIYPRSGLAANYNIKLANCVGVIDSDYRGEVMVLLENNGEELMAISNHQRIAQGLLQPVARTIFEEAKIVELSSTVRGTGGFGSTGV